MPPARKLTARKPPEVVQLLMEVRARIAGIKDWTIVEWFPELTHLRSLSVTHELGLHSYHPDIFDLPDGSVGQVGQQIITVVEPPELKMGDDVDGPYIVYPHATNEKVPLTVAGYLIPRQSLPVLIVSLSASDMHIREQVVQALRQRKRQPVLPRTTGAHSLSRSFADGHAFNKWLDHHIVELAELLAWRGASKEQRRKYPDVVLGAWIDEQKMTSHRTSEAIKMIRQAIEVLPSMLAEASKIELGYQSE